MLERDKGIGGTRWANTYPGRQCDMTSHLYSFSFAPNPDWSRTYPTQPEIRDYLRGCAERFGITEHIRFGCELTAAKWDEETALWRLQTSDGHLTADALVAAPGPLSEPGGGGTRSVCRGAHRIGRGTRARRGCGAEH